MKTFEKIKCIIDTDPGVDDSAAITLSLYDELMDIKLFTTVCGNRDVNTVTRNLLHILEKFNRTDIPVCMGASKALNRVSPDASHIHQQEGMGNYIPPKTVETKPQAEDAVEAMYKVIKENPHEICVVLLGPQTNMAMLIDKHPDVVELIKHIYCEGCAPYGLKSEGKWVNYVSFNASSDPEALKIVMESGIPITMIPSRMGRELANFTEKEVLKIRDINDTGHFLFEMYSGYWEHGYKDRRVATNDTCAVLALREPKFFKTKKAFFTVDVAEMPGRTLIEFNKCGNVDFAYKCNRKKLHKFYFDAVKKLDKFKFYKSK